MWNDIKDILLSNLKRFIESGILPKGFNSSFVTLVPKVSQPSKVTDFRPISLINTTSKLFTKLLANRMGMFMERLIDGNQFGFMKGRMAADSILIANEVCHSI